MKNSYLKPHIPFSPWPWFWQLGLILALLISLPAAGNAQEQKAGQNDEAVKALANALESINRTPGVKQEWTNTDVRTITMGGVTMLGAKVELTAMVMRRQEMSEDASYFVVQDDYGYELLVCTAGKVPKLQQKWGFRGIVRELSREKGSDNNRCYVQEIQETDRFDRDGKAIFPDTKKGKDGLLDLLKQYYLYLIIVVAALVIIIVVVSMNSRKAPVPQSQGSFAAPPAPAEAGGPPPVPSDTTTVPSEEVERLRASMNRSEGTVAYWGAFLKVVEGAEPGRVFELCSNGSTIMLGEEENGRRVAEAKGRSFVGFPDHSSPRKLSSEQSMIEKRGGSFYLRNGKPEVATRSFVNGKQLKESEDVELRDGDVIDMMSAPPHKIRFCVGNPQG